MLLEERWGGGVQDAQKVTDKSVCCKLHFRIGHYCFDVVVYVSHGTRSIHTRRFFIIKKQ